MATSNSSSSTTVAAPKAKANTGKAPAKPKVVAGTTSVAAKPKGVSKASTAGASKTKVLPATDEENATTATADTNSSDASDATPSKKKVLAVADPEFDRRLKEMLTGFDEVIARARECKQNGTELKKAYHQQIKDINKRRKVKRSGTTSGNSGFKIPSLVRGTKLHDFMNKPHGERLARQAVTQAIHKYAVDHELQVEGNRKLIQPDAVLEEIIGTAAERRAVLEEKKKHDKEGGPETKVNDEVGYFNLQTFLKKWFVTKAEEAKLSSTAAVTDTATATASS